MVEKSTLIEKELEDKRKLTKEVKEQINTKVFYNLIISIVYMVLMISINLMYLNAKLIEFATFTRLFSISSIVATIVIFETAYKKENVEIMFYAIEMLVFSIIAMYIPYVYIHMKENVRGILMLTPVFFAIYYVAKSIFVDLKISNEYINSLSDVKEIVKDEENVGYLDEDSTKLIKEINEIEAAKREEKKIIKEAKKKMKQEEKQKKSNNKKACGKEVKKTDNTKKK